MSARTRMLHAVLREHGRDLYARALLLTGDDAAAADLVERALATGLGRGHLPETAEEAEARVRDALHRAFRGLRGDEPPLPDLDDAAADGAVGDDPDIRVSLRLLPRRERVAIVLRYVDGLAATAIARQLDAPLKAVRADLEAGARTLTEARPDLRIDIDDAVEGGMEEALAVTLDGAR
ncbi:sigma factor-like helix-turn-helix DNA-binding protein [Demequina rhizosphaerae]|uniref:sigma factor-like helix-turn-helix DNA-binding protein n=1 Tax=Demequina rhizosphaerae TaxID=1638985 RepID=UPI000B013300|nr:sigma factor-like helix-turn-helix DNA-binding protein [Demequina rhizosphaerae]